MRAAIYIRKSRKDADRPSHRLTVQREQLPAYAQTQGWTFEVYDDGHASAARGKTEDLQERARMESDIRAGQVNIILTIELSRLSRDDSLQDYVAWLHLCGEYKVKLATMSRILDPAQTSDWMLLLMEGGFSSVEMKVLQARMKEGREQARRAGKYLGGPVPPPYTYDKAAEIPVIDPESLATMQRVWSLAETRSARQVAKETGLPHITVRRAISDDRLLFYQALRADPSGGELIICEWEPCMDAAQAERIRAARRNGHRGYKRNTASSLLSNLGIMVCGYCGRSVRAVGEHPRPNGWRPTAAYYGCQANDTARLCEKSRMHQQIILDDRIVTNLLGTLENITEIQNYWIASQNAHNDTERLDALDRDETLLKTKKQRLVAAVADGVLEFADAREKRTEIERGLESIRKQRAELQSSPILEPDWDALSIITRDNWEQMSLNEHRAMIRLTMRKIRLYANYAQIEYALPRGPNGDCTARVHLPPPAKSGPKSTKYNPPE